MNAFEAAEKEQRADALQADLVDLFERHNETSGERTSIPATYLKVVVAVP
jgi:hypothetical protein